MNALEHLYTELTRPTSAKLVLLVLDGLGDLAGKEAGYLTPLEAATTPHLDDLTQDSALGRMNPVAPGITPGNGPGQLGLFGYDPIEHQIGRGVIEALGLGLELEVGDIAARANFCTLDAQGIVSDRRAGRIDSTECQRLCCLLGEKIKRIDDIDVILRSGKGHRFVVVFRGVGMAGPLTDSDPHRDGVPMGCVAPLQSESEGAKKAADIIAKFNRLARSILASEAKANGVLLRGIAARPSLPSFEERYRLRASSLAIHPLYQGLGQLVGMRAEPGLSDIGAQFRRYLDTYEKYDYFFIHYRYTGVFGAEGQFDAKKKAIEDLDAALPLLFSKRPDVLAITGDHSSPCIVQGHSWHPQPVLLNSPFSGSDKLDRFTETTANLGSLGVFDAKYLIRLMQANARMFGKFGA